MLALNPHNLSILVRVSVLCGFDLDAILRQIDMTGYEASESATHLDIAAVEKLYAGAMAASTRGYFPFVFGNYFAFDRTPEVSLYLATCTRLQQALPLLDVLPHLAQPELIGRHSVDGSRLTLSFELENGHGRLEMPGYIETVQVVATRLIEQILGEAVRFEISFRHAPLTSLDTYEKQFHVTPRFGAAGNSLSLPAEYLDRPLNGRSSILNAKAQMLLDNRLRQLQAAQGLERSVELMVRQSPGISVDAVSQRLGMASRSLQRRLREAGTSFQAIQTRVRCQVATTLLLDRGMDLDDIAQKLGFADRNAFTKAFSKWTGSAPGKYRREALKA